MKWSLRKDLKYRKLYTKKENIYRILKGIDKNEYIKDKKKENIKKMLKKHGGYMVKINNCCLLSGRVKGVFRYFKLSRMEIKKGVEEKKLIGIRKISW